MTDDKPEGWTPGRPSIGMGYKHGSHRGPNPPKFCRGCGRPMVLGIRADGFDVDMGTPKFVPTARCTAPWWCNWVGATVHDEAEQDAYGDWPWTGIW